MDKTTNLFLVPSIFLLVTILFFTAEARPQSPDRDDEAILVGRIAHVDGEVLRYVPEEDDWVITVKDAPFGSDDALYSDRGRAELIMPNNTWVRIDKETQIQLIELSHDLTEIDVAYGVARFYNQGAYAVITATTPFGYVTAPENTSFEIFVTDEAVDIIPLEGTVDFVHRHSGTRYEAIGGLSSLLVDNRRVIAGEGHEDADWNAWNRHRDTLWAKRMKFKGRSGEYLPPGLYDHAYLLEDYGRWERVYYDGGYYNFWRPVHISVGWSPFTTGRWTVWYGHHTWIPYEPFGYVTHHYGNWIFTHGYWYWAPPVRWGGVHIGSPLLHLDFAWYPGRVAWIYHGVNIGWIPLAPYEPYYCHRRWGKRSVVLGNVGITNVYVNINKYRNHSRAVIVNQKDLYRVNNYRGVKIRGVSASTVMNHYRTTPVVTIRVIRHHPKEKEKYNFTNVKASGKPHGTTTARIKQNRRVTEQRRNAKDKTIVKEKTSTKRGTAGTKIKRLSTMTKTDLPSVNRSSRPAATLKTQGKRHEKKTTLTTKDRSRTQKEVKAQKKSIASKPLKQQMVYRGLQWQAKTQKRTQAGTIESFKKGLQALSPGTHSLRSRTTTRGGAQSPKSLLRR